MSERFLVTGAGGCIGAWVVAELVREGASVVAIDVSSDESRLALLLSRDDLASLAFVEVDITDGDAVEQAMTEHRATNIIHLAALQVPFCRADPVRGAAVNVGGTVNVFEAARKQSTTVRSIVYASSVAAYDTVDNGAAPGLMTGQPSTLYGVFKRADEGIATVYAEEYGIASVGLRPHTVYGVGRDQGLTSAPTQAMLCAAAGIQFRIPFGGRFQFQFARDVAHAFVAASRADASGASVHDLPGPPVSMADVVAAIEEAAPAANKMITFEDTSLPFPSELESSTLEDLVGPLPATPLGAGVEETVEQFRGLLASGRLTVNR